MEKYIHKLLLLLVLPLSVIMFTGCGGDDDDDIGSEDDLIGTWKSTGATIEFTIGDQDIVEWFAEQLGLSDAEAAQLADLFEEGFSEGFSGTITFNSDGTYSSNFEGDVETGDWTLSGSTLTQLSSNYNSILFK